MSLFGSLFSGVSGLNAQSRAMGMISDNIANVNTTAYKGALAQFENLVTRSRGSYSYSPGGVRAQSFYTVATQGLIQSSASPTDVAISGAGFFVVNAPPDGQGEQLYTRAGSFSPDFQGDLRTTSGHYLQGWALDADEAIVDVNTLQTVNVRSINGLAAATTTVALGANLDADAAVFAGAYAAGDLNAWNSSAGAAGVQPTFTRDVQVYDSLGRAHDLTLSFLRNGAANNWSVEVAAPPADVDAGTHPDGLLASGTLTFGGDGALQSAALTPVVSGGRGHARRRPVVGRRRCRTQRHLVRLRRDRRRRRRQPVRQPDQRRLRQPERGRGRRAQLGQHRRPGLRHRLVHQRRGAPALPAAGGHLRQSGRARPALGQCLRLDRRLGRVQPARGRHGRRRRGRPLGAGGGQRRHRRGVHQDDRHAARLLGQRQDHQHHR